MLFSASATSEPAERGAAMAGNVRSEPLGGQGDDRPAGIAWWRTAKSNVTIAANLAFPAQHWGEEIIEYSTS